MASLQWHARTRGLHGAVHAPGMVQSIVRRTLAGRHGHTTHSSCWFVLSPVRQQIRVKGLSFGSGRPQWFRRYCQQRSMLLRPGSSRRSSTAGHAGALEASDSLHLGLPEPSYTASHPVYMVTDALTGHTYRVFTRRSLTARQATRLIRLWRLQAARAPWDAGDSDSHVQARQHKHYPVPSHPLSVTSSSRVSESGILSPGTDGMPLSARTNATSRGRPVQGLPELPSRAASVSSVISAQQQQHKHRSLVTLQLLHEFLRQDYAVGYVILGWLLRCTWNVAPAIALLLGMPKPAQGSERHLLALLAWLLQDSGSRPSSSNSDGFAMLSDEQLEQLQEQLLGPTAVLISLGSQLRAQQALPSTSATPEQQLMGGFGGINLSDNLMAATAAAAVMAQMSAEQQKQFKQQLAVVMESLDAAVAGAANDADCASEALNNLAGLLQDQLQQADQPNDSNAAVFSAILEPVAADPLPPVAAANTGLSTSQRSAASQLLQNANSIPAGAEQHVSQISSDMQESQQQQQLDDSPIAIQVQQQQPLSSTVMSPAQQPSIMQVFQSISSDGSSQQAVAFVGKTPTINRNSSHQQLQRADEQQAQSVATGIQPFVSFIAEAGSRAGQVDWRFQATWLQAWAANQAWVLAAAAATAGSTAQKLHRDVAAAAASVAAAVGAAQSTVDGKDSWKERTFKEQVLAASGLLALISPEWWTEETLSGLQDSANAQAGPAARQVASGVDIVAVGDGIATAQVEFWPGEGGVGGVGTGNHGKPPRRGGGGRSSGNNDSSDAGDSDEADAGSSGGQDDGSGAKNGGNGGNSGSGGQQPPGAGDAWDGFNHFPAASLDPVVLLPVALAAAASAMGALLGPSTAAPALGSRQQSSTSRGLYVVISPKHHQPTGLAKARKAASNIRYAASQLSPPAARGSNRPHSAARKPAAGAAANAAVVVDSAPGSHMARQALSATVSGRDAVVGVSQQHYCVHLPSADEEVLEYVGFEHNAAVADGSVQRQEQGSNRTQSAETVQTASVGLVAGSTSHQVDWDELEELPLVARQEILSLRTVAAGNKHQQAVLQKQLQAMEQQLQAKEQELAFFAARTTALQAELAAAGTDAALSDFPQEATKGLKGEQSAVSKSSDNSNLELKLVALRKSYQQQLEQVLQGAAATRREQGAQVQAMQAQLEFDQQAAGTAIADLEMRVSKLTASKVKVQRDVQHANAVWQADLHSAKQKIGQLQCSHATEVADLTAAQQQVQLALSEAAAQLQHTRAELAAEQAARQQLQAEYTAALAAWAVTEQQLKDDLATAVEHVGALTADSAHNQASLAASAASSKQLQQQLQDLQQELSAMSGQHRVEKQGAANRAAEVVAELAGWRAGVQPLIAGLEAEMAAERANAAKQVAQLRQQLAVTDELHEQLHQQQPAGAAAQAQVSQVTEDISGTRATLRKQLSNEAVLRIFEAVTKAATQQANCIVPELAGTQQAQQQQHNGHAEHWPGDALALVDSTSAVQQQQQQEVVVTVHNSSLGLQQERQLQLYRQLQAQWQEQQAVYEANISNVEVQLNQATAQCCQLQQDIAAAATKADSRAAALAEEIDSWKSIAQQAALQIADLASKLDAANIKAAALQAELTKLHSRHIAETSALEETVQSAEQQRADIEQQLVEARDATQHLQAGLAQAMQAAAASEAAWQARFAAAEATTADQVLNLEAAIVVAQAELAAAGQAAGDSEAAWQARLAAANAAAAEQVSSLKGAVAAAEAATAAATMVAAQAAADSEAAWQLNLAAANAATAEKISSLEAAVATAQVALAEAAQAAAGSEAAWQTKLVETQAAAGDKVSSLEAAVVEARAILTAAAAAAELAAAGTEAAWQARLASADEAAAEQVSALQAAVAEAQSALASTAEAAADSEASWQSKLAVADAAAAKKVCSLQAVVAEAQAALAAATAAAQQAAADSDAAWQARLADRDATAAEKLANLEAVVAKAQTAATAAVRAAADSDNIWQQKLAAADAAAAEEVSSLQVAIAEAQAAAAAAIAAATAQASADIDSQRVQVVALQVEVSEVRANLTAATAAAAQAKADSASLRAHVEALQTELAQLQASHAATAAAKSQAEADAASSLAQLEAARSELAGIKATREAIIAAMEAQYNAAMAADADWSAAAMLEAAEEHEAETALLQQHYASAVVELQQHDAAAIAELTASHQAALAAVKTQLEGEELRAQDAAAQHAAAVAAQTAMHQKALAALNTQLSSANTKAQNTAAEHGHQLARLQQHHATAIADMQAQHQFALAALEAQVTAAANKARNVAREHEQQLMQLQQQHAAAIGVLADQQQHDSTHTAANLLAEAEARHAGSLQAVDLQHKQQLNQLQEELASATAEAGQQVSALQQQLEQLVSRAKQRDAKLQQLCSTLQGATDSGSNLEEEAAATTQQVLGQTEAIHVCLQQQLQQQAAGAAATAAQLQGTLQQLQQCEQAAGAVGAELAATKQQLRKARTLHEETLQELDASKATSNCLTEQLKHQQAQTVQLAAEVAKLGKGVMSLEQQLEQSKWEKQQAEAQLQTQVGVQTMLQEQAVVSATEQQQAMQLQLDGSSAQCRTLQEKLSAAQAEVASLQATAAQQTVLKEQVTSAAAEQQQAMQLQLDDSSAQRSKLQEQLLTAEAKVASMQMQLAEQANMNEQAIITATKQQHALQQQLDDSSGQCNQLQGQLSAAQAEVVALQASAAKQAMLRQQAASAAVEQQQTWQIQLEDGSNRCQALQEQMSEAQAEVLALRAQITQQALLQEQAKAAAAAQQQALQLQLDECRNSCHKLQEQLSAAQAEVMVLQAQAAQQTLLKQQEMAAGAEQQQAMQLQLDDRIGVCQAVQERLAAVQAEVQSLQAAAEASAQQLAILGNEKAAFSRQQVQAARAQEELLKQCAALQASSDEVDAERVQLQQEAIELQKQVTDLQQQIKDLAQQQQCELAALQEQQQQQLQKLQQQVQTLTDNVHAATSDAADAQQQLQLSQQQLADMRSSAEAAVTAQRAAEGQVQDMQQQLQALSYSSTAAASDAAGAKQQLQFTEQQLTDTRALAGKAVTAEREANGRVQVLQQQLVSVQLQLQEVQQQLADTQTHAGKADIAHKRVEVQIQELQQQYVTVQAQLQAAEQQLTDTKAHAGKTSAAHKQAESLVQDLQQQLGTAHKQLQEFQQQQLDIHASAEKAQKQAQVEVQELQQQLVTVRVQLQDAQKQLSQAKDQQSSLATQLLSAETRVLKLDKDNSCNTPHPDASWVLPAGSTGGSTNADGSEAAALEAALQEAKHQLTCWEQDVMALKFVAEHEAFEDICDLDMSYNSAHLQAIHQAILKLRKALLANSSKDGKQLTTTSFSEAANPAATNSKGSTSSSSSDAQQLNFNSRRAAVNKQLLALEAQAGSAQTRSIAVASALDTSLQAMQAAKLSLMTMHNKDLKLELFSQSAKELLEDTLNAIPQSPLPAAKEALKTGITPSQSIAADASIPESLLAATTLQEVKDIVSRVFSTSATGTGAAANDAEAAGGAGMGTEAGVQTSCASGADAAEQQQELVEQIDNLHAANAELEASKAQMSSSLQKLQHELQVLQQERGNLHQQSTRTASLEEQVCALQGQLADLMRQNKELVEQLAAARAHMLHSRDGIAADASSGPAADGEAAVRAVRAATHSFLLRSGPFELEPSEEQVMLPTPAFDEQAPNTAVCSHPGVEALKTAADDPNWPHDLQSPGILQPMLYDAWGLNVAALQGNSVPFQMLSSLNDEMCMQPSSLETDAEYMHYTNPALMSQSTAEATIRRPGLPTQELAEGEESEYAMDASIAAGHADAASTAGDGMSAGATSSSDGVVPGSQGVIQASTAALRSVEHAGARGGDAARQVAKQLTQQALSKLGEEKGGLKSWNNCPGGGTGDSQVLALIAVAHDINELGAVSTELAQQQAAVQQQLAAAQAIAAGLREQAAHCVSKDEVVEHFCSVYNITCFVAADRERVLDQLIEACTAQQDLSSQLATCAGQAQQLAADRDLALHKLCHSEEKLVALESQLSALQQEMQNKQAELSAKEAALDVAAGATGPLAGLSAQQVAELHEMLGHANCIVQQQRGLMQEAVLRWKRSSGGARESASGGAAASSTDGDSSSIQLALLQHQQQQLLQELSELSSNITHSSSGGSNLLQEQVIEAADMSSHEGVSHKGRSSSMSTGHKGAPGIALQLPADVVAYVASLASRMAALQALTEQISVQVVVKHEEALGLQAGFMQVEVTKQLLEKQLLNKSNEAAELHKQVQQLKAACLSQRGQCVDATATAPVSAPLTTRCSNMLPLLIPEPEPCDDFESPSTDYSTQQQEVTVVQHAAPHSGSIEPAIQAAPTAAAAAASSLPLSSQLSLRLSSRRALSQQLSGDRVGAFGHATPSPQPSPKGSTDGALQSGVTAAAKSAVSSGRTMPGQTTPRGESLPSKLPAKSVATAVAAAVSHSRVPSSTSNSTAAAGSVNAAAAASGLSSRTPSAKSLGQSAAKPSRIPAVASGGSTIAAAGTHQRRGSETASRGSSTASSPRVLPSPKAVAGAGAAAGSLSRAPVDRSAPIFKASKATAAGAGGKTAPGAAGKVSGNSNSSAAGSRHESVRGAAASGGASSSTDGVSRRLVRMLSGSSSSSGANGDSASSNSKPAASKARDDKKVNR